MSAAYSRDPTPGATHRGTQTELVWLGLTAGCLAGGGLALLVHASVWANRLWAFSTAVMLLIQLFRVARDLARGRVGVDRVALLAMAGALLLGEALAGAVIALMLATGGALERLAQARAQRALKALLARAPREAWRLDGGRLTRIPIEAIRPTDVLLVRAGEVVPVDGRIRSTAAVLDESALTGEARAVTRPTGEPVASGVLNAGPPFELVATATAAASTYAGVIRLVQAAQAEKAPFVRLADRYALLFVPLTLAVAALAWALAGDPVRALAVLVVATPCPLVLAAPVALVAGISRAARRGVLIKGGGALEALARAEVLLLDKTGTLTSGQPTLVAVDPAPPWPADEVLRLAASLEQASQHVVAAAVVRAATERGLRLTAPAAVAESPGEGIRGTVEGREVLAGGARWLARVQPGGVHSSPGDLDGGAAILVAVDGQPAGALRLTDPLRPDAARAVRALRRAGIRRVVMVSGDRRDVAEGVGMALGLDAVLAERTPAEKVAAVHEAKATGATAMVGDGINDAPALAAADVGVALGARGASASSEAADVVLLVDRLDRLADGLRIARRARYIARQSVVVGMGLSFVAMGFAAAGYLPPVIGAVLQEGIDVLVILNALRALRDPGRPRAQLESERGRRLAREHLDLLPVIERLEAVADRLDALPGPTARAELVEAERRLRDTLLPHERADDRTLYPELAPLLGGDDPLSALSHSHREIFLRSDHLQRMIASLPADGPSADDRRTLRRLLYGLAAILRLHNAQEEELFHAVTADEPAPVPRR